VTQSSTAALALTVALTVGAAPRPQEGPTLGLSAVRSYRSASAQTLVDVFCRVPLAAVSPLGGEGGRAVFRIALDVRDSSGLTLTSQSWSEGVPGAMLKVRGASTAEHMAFAVKPGRYSVAVTVTDSATGRVTHQQTRVDAFTDPPPASDLLLGTDIRLIATPADSALRPGEIRKGALVVQTSGDPVLTPQSSKLGYYLELYPAKAESLAIVVRVLRSTGEQVIATTPQRAGVGAGGGVTQGIVDLAGLPPGRYLLEVRAGGDSGLTRTAPFGMTGFETLATAQQADAAGGLGGAPEDPFSRMTEPQLDSTYLPLVYLMTSNEQGVYSTLTVEGKRNWLRQFWAKRDPTPGTLRNEEHEAFQRLVAEANRRFREGGSTAIPGWRTDRGRVFIKYGQPDEVLERHQSASSPPYEVWKYTRGRPLKYVFMDLTRFGNYALIYTDDRREPSRPNWEELLGPEGVQDVQRF
jgi:GWxTD domain-containing protein